MKNLNSKLRFFIFRYLKKTTFKFNFSHQYFLFDREGIVFSYFPVISFFTKKVKREYLGKDLRLRILFLKEKLIVLSTRLVSNFKRFGKATYGVFAKSAKTPTRLPTFFHVPYKRFPHKKKLRFFLFRRKAMHERYWRVGMKNEIKEFRGLIIQRFGDICPFIRAWPLVKFIDLLFKWGLYKGIDTLIRPFVRKKFYGLNERQIRKLFFIGVGAERYDVKRFDLVLRRLGSFSLKVRFLLKKLVKFHWYKKFFRDSTIHLKILLSLTSFSSLFKRDLSLGFVGVGFNECVFFYLYCGICISKVLRLFGTKYSLCDNLGIFRDKVGSFWGGVLRQEINFTLFKLMDFGKYLMLKLEFFWDHEYYLRKRRLLLMNLLFKARDNILESEELRYKVRNFIGSLMRYEQATIVNLLTRKYAKIKSSRKIRRVKNKKIVSRYKKRLLRRKKASN